MTPTESLVKEIAERAEALVGMKVSELRLLHPQNLAGTISGVQWLGISKGSLICDILRSEFS